MTSAYVHEALYYDSDDVFLAVAVPFLREGLSAGESVAVSVTPRTSSLLAGSLGTEHERLEVLPAPTVFQRTAIAVASLRRFFEGRLAAGAPGLRVLGEVPSSRDTQAWAEWTRYEAVINRALAPYPLWGLCPYDARALPEPVLAAGRMTHPNLSGRGGRAANPAFRDPVLVLRDIAAMPDPLSEQAADVGLDVRDLRTLRQVVRDAIDNLTPGAPARTEFVTAVNEVAANALQHGRPPVTARLWVSPHRLVCSITDRGLGFDDPLVGYLRPGSAEPVGPGMGLWLARHLCDEIAVGHTPDGFTVRLATRATSQAMP